MKNLRINTETGIVEEHEETGLMGSIVESLFGEHWDRTTDSNGTEYRVNTDTGEIETHDQPGVFGTMIEGLFGEFWERKGD